MLKATFRFTLALASAALFAVSLPGAAAAQDGTAKVLEDGAPIPVAPSVVARDGAGRVTVRAVRVAERIVVDGALDDDVYTRTEAISGFLQQEPREGQPATERTEAWLLFDDENIYVSARCWDSHPERIVANEMRRDSMNIAQNDSFGVIFDTFHDRRNGFFFYTNLLGALSDQTVTDEVNSNREWNTLWEVRTRRFDQGWSVEIAIPFKSLRYPRAGEQVWGVNFRRVIRHENQVTYLTPMPQSYGMRGIQRVSRAATLVGLSAPPAGQNLEIKPYALSGVATDVSEDAVIPYTNDLSANAGFDVKYGLGRGMVGDFTYRTDFAQVEEDEQQVNLTRFSLYFPERREFFLEGQGIFAFGGVQTNRGGGHAGPPSNTPVLFFSRRIGLVENDDDMQEAVPLRIGGRVTGKVGKYSIGFLDIQTGRAPAIGTLGTNFGVIRVKRDILRRSAVGIIGTYRSHTDTDPGSSSTFGVDANLAFFQNLSFNAYWATTRGPGDAGRDASYRAQLQYDGDTYGLEIEHLTVEPNFQPELGFLRREDFRRNYARARYSPRPASWRGVRKISVEGSIDYFTDNAGLLETREAQASYRMDLENGDQVSAEYSRSYEFLTEAFDITDDITLPVGGYAYDDVRASYQMGPQRRVSGSFSGSAGSFYDGTKKEAGYRGRVEITPKLSLEPGLSWNWVRLQEGSFTAKLVTARVSYGASPRMNVAGLVQYNSASEALSTNLRFRWEYKPGSELFVVYSEGRDTALGRRLPRIETRSFVIKVTRLFRF